MIPERIADMSLRKTKIPVDSCKSSDKTNSVQSKQRSSFSDVNVEQSHGHLKRDIKWNKRYTCSYSVTGRN